MRNEHYKVKTFRLSEETYLNLKKRKPKDLSWNLYFMRLLSFSKNKHIQPEEHTGESKGVLS